MTDAYPNPWNFHNTDSILVSPDHLHKAVYYNLNEIAMGAPIGGPCFLETSDGKKVKIHDWCGGPPAWETDGRLIAIPVWTRNLLKGTVQQIGIVDTGSLELTLFAETFRVLHIRSFSKTTIYGFDSPIYATTPVTFDIEKEAVDTVIRLTE